MVALCVIGRVKITLIIAGEKWEKEEARGQGEEGGRRPTHQNDEDHSINRKRKSERGVCQKRKKETPSQ